jgi:hypothetical protein
MCCWVASGATCFYLLFVLHLGDFQMHFPPFPILTLIMRAALKAPDVRSRVDPVSDSSEIADLYFYYVIIAVLKDYMTGVVLART